MLHASATCITSTEWPIVLGMDEDRVFRKPPFSYVDRAHGTADDQGLAPVMDGPTSGTSKCIGTGSWARELEKKATQKTAHNSSTHHLRLGGESRRLSQSQVIQKINKNHLLGELHDVVINPVEVHHLMQIARPAVIDIVQ